MTRLGLSLNKESRVNERMRFRSRAVAYNFTKSPIFQSMYSMIITAPNFGQIRAAQGERNMQLVGRFYF